MLEQFIPRRLRPPAAPVAADASQNAARPIRPADWLLGGSVATLAVVFVAGLLGLRASTADLQDQSRSNARDLAALKADTLERIEGISGTLAKTNQTLTDLLALRSGPPAAKGRSAVAGDGGTAEGEDGRAVEARPAKLPPVAPSSARVAAAPKPMVRSVAKPAARSTGKPDAVRLSTLTVRRRPERERNARRPEPPPRPVAAARPPAKTPAQLRREAILRELRLRRLAGRGYGAL